MKDACHASRACGLFGMYMTYGYGISLFNILVAGLLVFKKDLKNIVPTPFIIFVLVINIIGMHLSYTRGGVLGFLFALPFFYLKDYKKKFLSIGLAGLLILFGAFTFSPKVKDMFMNRQASNTQRLAFYEAAFYAFKEKPILGWGYRNFQPNVTSIKKKYDIAHPNRGGHAHNNLLEHLASTGILGFIAVLGFFVSWMYESYKRNDFIGKISFVFGVSFFTSGLFQYTFGDGENVFMLMGVWVISQIPVLKNKA